MKSHRLGTAMVLMLIASWVGAGDPNRRVMGHVLDKKSPKNKPVGIAGVVVQAFNTQDVLLMTTVTNHRGEYILEGIEPGVVLTIKHSKVNYRRDPEIFEGAVPSDGVTVYLGKKNGDLAYYREVGNAIVDRSTKEILDCGPSYGSYEICHKVDRVADDSLQEEWRAVRELDFPPEQTSIIWEQVTKQLTIAHLEPLIKVDAGITASEVSSFDPDKALEVARARGFNPEVYFEFDKTDLSDKEKEKLIYAAAFLQSSRSFDLTIEGHADEGGTNEYNMALADRRAGTVRDFLVGEGLSPDRIRTLAYGEERPVCTATEEDCFKLNRRAHFVLRPKTPE